MSLCYLGIGAIIGLNNETLLSLLFYTTNSSQLNTIPRLILFIILLIHKVLLTLYVQQQLTGGSKMKHNCLPLVCSRGKQGPSLSVPARWKVGQMTSAF